MHRSEGRARVERPDSRWMSSRWRFALSALLLPALASVGLGALVPGSPASAAGNGQFSLSPSNPPGTTLARPYFTPVLTAGVPSSDSFVVTNQTAKPINFYLYSADAYTTDGGAFALKHRLDPKKKMGAWIKLPSPTLTVPAESGTIVPFTYDVPAGTPPGDYAGGIVAEETTGTITNSGAVKIQALEAVGTAVFGQVKGVLRPRLAVTAVSMKTTRPFASQFGGSVDATVTYSVSNTGNQNLTPVVTLSLSPLIGSGQTTKVKLPQILPGSTVTFAHKFSDVVPFGALTVKVTARASGASATGSAGAIIVPWGLVIVLAVLAVGFWLWRRRAPIPEGAAAEGDSSEPADSADVAVDEAAPPTSSP